MTEYGKPSEKWLKRKARLRQKAENKSPRRPASDYLMLAGAAMLTVAIATILARHGVCQKTWEFEEQLDLIMSEYKKELEKIGRKLDEKPEGPWSICDSFLN